VQEHGRNVHDASRAARHDPEAVKGEPRLARQQAFSEGTMENFVYNAHAARVIFGFGTLAEIAGEVRRLGRRALVLSTPQQIDQAHRLAATLGDLTVGVFAEAAMHTPVDVTARAMNAVRALGADCTVALGGGSTTGLGKAIALRTDLPQIVIPTTYAGSEMTPILGETSDGAKKTIRDAKVLPETVIYDVDLSMSLPPALSASSGMNAIAHSVEALYAQDANPIVSLMAVEGIEALAKALPAIVENRGNRDARWRALYGAWLSGMCLGAVGMGLHHKLCHTLGGAFDLPHAETHTIVLPHAVAYNARATQPAMARIAAALGADEAAGGLYDLAGRIGAKRALRDIGMPEEGVARAAEMALANPYWNPRPLDLEAIRQLIARAWSGAPPDATV
jgi:maleylacetate reductase